MSGQVVPETFCPNGHPVPGIFSSQSHPFATLAIFMSSFRGFLLISWTAQTHHSRTVTKQKETVLFPQNVGFQGSGMGAVALQTRSVLQGRCQGLRDRTTPLEN